MADMMIVAIWSVLAGPRRSIGACRLLLVVTLRPPSRTCRSMSTMSIMAEIKIMGVIGKIKVPESVAKSLYFAIIFLQFTLMYGNMVL